MGIIGGADGPTSIFVAGSLGAYWINLFGLVIVMIMLVPNTIYTLKFRNQKNKCENKIMNILEQIGRYSSMIFMVFTFGQAEFAFTSLGRFMVYFIGNFTLLAIYLIVWILYFIKQKSWKRMTLAIVPSLIFLVSGITLGNIMLVISGGIFAVSHSYVTYKNC